MQKIAIMVGSVYGGAEYVAEQAVELLSKKAIRPGGFSPQSWMPCRPLLPIAG